MAKRGREQRVLYDLALMEEDMLDKGWNLSTLSRQSGIPRARVCRFFTGEFQTPATAAGIAKALEHPVRRYLKRAEEAATA